MVTGLATTLDARRTAPDGRPYLSGVQGLRTIAALLVAVYHVWFSRVSGGVDVFFVVAGFFATLSLLKLEHVDDVREGVQFVWQYLLRTARRVVPPAGIVIAVTALAAVAWMPASLWYANLRHGVASVVFAENWRLIQVETDYLQQGLSATPFQQFWALAIQVQFYAMFPVIILAAIFSARLRRVPARRAVLAVAVTIFAASFTYSVHLTRVDQPVAYFNTFTRLWEFMVGAIVALLLTRKLKSSLLGRILGWTGLIVLFAFGAVLDLSTLLPGAIALIPAGAAILIIISSYGSHEPRLLRCRPAMAFANASFSFYLWHWPLLIFYRYRVSEEVSLLGGLGILALSCLLAVATTQLVESPIRNSPLLRRSAVATLVAVVLALTPAAAALTYWNLVIQRAYAAGEADVRALGAGERPTGTLIPAPIVARDDVVDGYATGCHQTIRDPALIKCVSGEEGDGETIALVGGSHSLQWLDVVRAVAGESNGQVVSMTKSGCVFGDVGAFDVGTFHPSCAEWSAAVLDELLADPPDAVVTIATRRAGSREQVGGREEIPEGYRAYFEVLSAAGIPVLGIRDNPWFEEDIPKCVELRDPDVCGLDRDDVYGDLEALEVPESEMFTFVDAADDYCTASRCGVIQGNVLVYRDQHHLTRTWTLLHGQVVADPLRDLL